MKTGSCFISKDGNSWVDIYDMYGVLVALGGYNNLLSFPSIKTPKSNDWVEEDYEEVDLSELHVNNRNVTIKFLAILLDSDWERFVNYIIDAKEILFKPSEVSTKVFRLRYVSTSSLRYGAFVEFSINFEEDVPWGEIERVVNPEGGAGQQNDYLINGVPLAEFNAKVLKGTKSSVLKKGNAKGLLTITNSVIEGQIYDTDGRVSVGNKEFTLNCIMRGMSVESFWHNYISLFSFLMRGGEDGVDKHVLNLNIYDRDFKCHYLRQSVSQFYVDNGKVWCEFGITFKSLGEPLVPDVLILDIGELDHEVLG